MDKPIILGKIVKPQGIKGEVKVLPYTEDVMRFNALKVVLVDNIRHTIDNVRISGYDLYVKFREINDRNIAETYRGKEISVMRSVLSAPPEGRYLISDMLGCRILIDGEIKGVLEDILQNGSADVYVVMTKDNKTLMFPALKDLILKVDIDNKVIELDKKRFLEVAVYED